MRMKYLWNDYGMNMEWLWNDYGMIMEWVWNEYGMIVEWLWNEYAMQWLWNEYERSLCRHKNVVHAPNLMHAPKSCACTRFLCRHQILVHAQDSCVCTKTLCMHKLLVHAQVVVHSWEQKCHTFAQHNGTERVRFTTKEKHKNSISRKTLLHTSSSFEIKKRPFF